jgi:drug/metabolite transporter (DMT)-like permease
VTAIVLALLSALTYGVSDYVGGRASRIRPALLVSLSAELWITVCAVAVVPLVESGWPDDPRVWWGALGGLCGSIGVLGLFRSLSSGAMTVVAPIIGVVSAAVPVTVGFALGDRPAAMAVGGIIIAVVAVALIGGMVGVLHHPVAARILLTAVGSGVFFGLLFVFFAQTGETGLWPLLTARTASMPFLLGVYLVSRRSGRVERFNRDVLVPGIVVGVLVSLANGLYLVSTREGLLAVVAVLVSLYPAATISLAMVLDRERATRWQVLGMVLAGVGVALITLA